MLFQVVVGSLLIVAGLIHVLFAPAMLRVYQRMNRRRSPVTQAWMGWSKEGPRVGGGLMLLAGMFLVFVWR